MSMQGSKDPAGAQMQQQRVSNAAMTPAQAQQMQQQQRASLGGTGVPQRVSLQGVPDQGFAQTAPGFIDTRPIIAPEPAMRNPEADNKLIMAAHQGKETEVTAAILGGAYVNMVDGTGTTPLLAAVDGGHLEVVKVLIANGADVNKSRPDGQSPLLVAYKTNKKKILKELTSAAFSTLNRAVNSTGQLGYIPQDDGFLYEDEVVSTVDLFQAEDELRRLMEMRVVTDENAKTVQAAPVEKMNPGGANDGVSMLREGAVRLLMQDLTKVTSGTVAPVAPP